MDDAATATLRSLLRHRLDLIADHAFRDRDPAAHLDALRTVSEEITAWQETHRHEIPRRLDHFLTSCSYEKALRFVDSGGTWMGH
ncbi:MAG: hypothetical protein MUF31_10160 [Akkermansiaceae bacterium]|jgi:hypothetical protein|nr:hypothetical protein [Akkermansiaceae bacterium]